MSADKTGQRVLELFTDLLAVPSPSGREERLARLIYNKLKAWGYAPGMDAAGNVVVRLDGRDPQAPLICIAAHMDEIGMVVTNIGDDGSLSVNRSGGLKPWKHGEGPVTILGDEEDITGVLSMGSTHTKGESDKAIAWDQVRVMTGLSPAQLAAAGIRPGSTAVPVQAGRGPVVFGDPADPMVAAWTFDDRMGCVAQLRLLEILAETGGRAKAPTVILFTVREEEGGFGARDLADPVEAASARSAFSQGRGSSPSSGLHGVRARGFPRPVSQREGRVHSLSEAGRSDGLRGEADGDL